MRNPRVNPGLSECLSHVEAKGKGMNGSFFTSVWPGAAAVLLMTAMAPATVYHAELPVESYGDLSQQDVPGFGWSACGPTSATNSMVYLQQTYPELYGTSLVSPQSEDLDGDGSVDFYDDMIATVITLGSPAYMDTAALGHTPQCTFMWGEYLYIEQRAPGVTNYAGMCPYDWTYYDPPGWVEFADPTWQFLYDGLNEGAAMEIAVLNYDFGHYLSLHAFHWDDANDNGIIDYKEDAWIGFVDAWDGLPSTTHIYHKSGAIWTEYSDTWIALALATTPIPAPGGLALAVLAGLYGGGRRRR